MYWRITAERREGALETSNGPVAGRFVLQRHRDSDGTHLDLRLEQGDCLVGWRIAGTDLAGTCWATEKRPHPVRWLDDDGDGERSDAGVYSWIERGGDRRRIELRGRDGEYIVRAERVEPIAVETIRAIAEAVEACRAEMTDAARLIRDGGAARRRAIDRFCGLGRELDGAAFETKVWRKALEGLSLDEIHDQMRIYEVRFDEKYVPAPISRPERLPEEAGDRGGLVMAIAKEG